MGNKQRKKAAKAQSLTQHPLFSATVALWFGALFGLGSLAIRPALVEDIVIATGIDAIVPMLAPPLGVTTRILLALLMAGIGGFLGARLARHVAKPKPVNRERKRSADAERVAHKPKLSEPIPAHTGRKRALALHDEGLPDPDLDEMAPLPGGGPAILDVSEFDLEGFESHTDDTAEFEEDDSNYPHEPEAPAPRFDEEYQAEPTYPIRAKAAFEPSAETRQEEHTTMDNTGFHDRFGAESSREPFDESEAAGEPAPPFQPYPLGTPGQGAKAKEDANAGMPFGAPDEPSPMAGNSEQDTPEEAAPALPRFNSAPCDDGHAQTARQSIFERASSEPLFAEPDGGATPADPGSGERFASASESGGAHFGSSIDDPDDFWGDEEAAAATPDDAEPFDASAAAVSDEATDVASIRAIPAHVSGSADASAAASVPRVADHAPEPVVAEQPEAAAASEAHATAAERIRTAELTDLSHVELLERMALSLKRRSSIAEPKQAPEPSRAEPRSEPAAQPVAAVEQATEKCDPPAPTIPAALRPLDLGEEDEEDFSSWAPPRNIVGVPVQDAEPAPFSARGPASDEPAGQAAPVAHAMPQAYSPETADEGSGQETDADDSEDEGLLEEGYSSLLNLSRSPQERGEFVRIEEPEENRGEIEPVVVFPGQEARHANSANPARPGEPRADEQPVHRPEPGAARQNVAESEQALRAALATLQRMSGAA